MFEYFAIREVVTGSYYSYNGDWITPTAYTDSHIISFINDIMIFMDKNSAEHQINLLGGGLYTIDKLYLVNY